MSGISGFSSYTLQLFGASKRPMTSAPSIQPVNSAPIAAARVVNPSTQAPAKKVDELAGMRVPTPNLEGMEERIAAAKERQAKINAFAEENGYIPRNTQALKNAYHSVKAGNVDKYSYSNDFEAADSLTGLAGKISGEVKHLNYMNRALNDGTLDAVAEMSGQKRADQMEARFKDHIAAGEMDIFISSKILQNTLGISTPLYSKVGGEYVVNKVTLNYNGKPLIQMNPGEYQTMFDASGKEITVAEYFGSRSLNRTA